MWHSGNSDKIKKTAFASESRFESRPTAFERSQFAYLPQQFLYFLPLPQGHGSLRPTFGPVRTGLALALACASAAPAASLTTSLALGPPPPPPVPVLVPPPPPKALVVVCKVCCGAARRKFSNAIRDDALRKTLRQISVFTLTISSSKILNASALYSSSGSRWPCARRPMLWRRLSIS